MKFYLAARYSRREELCGYRDQLLSLGHEVQAKWLDGQHQISDAGVPIGEDGEKLIRGEDDDKSTEVRTIQLRAKFAREDYDDVMACNAIIAFTEKPRSELTRGGRHVELGIAIGAQKCVLVVGPRENIFCWLDSVLHFASWSDCYRTLAWAKQNPHISHPKLETPDGLPIGMLDYSVTPDAKILDKSREAGLSSMMPVDAHVVQTFRGIRAVDNYPTVE